MEVVTVAVVSEMVEVMGAVAMEAATVEEKAVAVMAEVEQEGAERVGVEVGEGERGVAAMEVEAEEVGKVEAG